MNEESLKRENNSELYAAIAKAYGPKQDNPPAFELPDLGTKQMNLQEKEDEVRAKLKDLARTIKAELPEGFGFVLLCSAFGDGSEGSATLYVANVRRLDALQLMREFIAVNREGQNYAKEMPEVESDAEFEAFFAAQQARNPPGDLMRWCRDAYLAGRASVYALKISSGSGKTVG